jgi:hypothetical protein
MPKQPKDNFLNIQENKKFDKKHTSFKVWVLPRLPSNVHTKKCRLPYTLMFEILHQFVLNPKLYSCMPFIQFVFWIWIGNISSILFLFLFLTMQPSFHIYTIWKRSRKNIECLVVWIHHYILEPLLGRPFKKESKTTLIPKIW